MAISEDTQAIIDKLEEVKLAVNGVASEVVANRNEIIETRKSVDNWLSTLHKDNVLAIQEELNERGYEKKYNLDKIAADVAAKKR